MQEHIYTIQKVKPDPNCPECHGRGEVYDWVDYGSTRVSMPSLCENCVLSQWEEDADEIELDIEDFDGFEGQDRDNYTDDQDRDNYTLE